MPKKKLFDDYSSDEADEDPRENLQTRVKPKPESTLANEALLQALTEKMTMMENSKNNDFDKQAVVKQLRKIESCVDKLRYLKEVEAEEKLRLQKAKMKKKKEKIKREKETLAVKEKALQDKVDLVKKKEVVKNITPKEESTNINKINPNSESIRNKKGLGHKKRTINLDLAAEKILNF